MDDSFLPALRCLYGDLFGEFRLPDGRMSTGKVVEAAAIFPDSAMRDLIRRRRSTRSGNGPALTLPEALCLLRDAVGVTQDDAQGVKFAVPLAAGVPELRMFVFVRETGANAGCWEFLQKDACASKLDTPQDFNPFIDSWERTGALSIIFGYPLEPARTYANNLLHACVEIGLMSQNIALLALERFGRQSCLGGIVDVPGFSNSLGREVLPLHAITIG
jgi:hypothetical protein